MYRKETRAGSIRTTLRKLSMPISCPTTFPSPPFFSAQLYVKPIFYSERHSFLGRSSPGAAWRAIEVPLSQKCSAISLA